MGREALELVLRYIVEVTQRPELGPLRAFVYATVGPEAEAAMATIAEQLIEQGIEQGELKGKRELLLRQLRHRFGEEVTGEAERRVATATC